MRAHLLHADPTVAVDSTEPHNAQSFKKRASCVAISPSVGVSVVACALEDIAVGCGMVGVVRLCASWLFFRLYMGQ